ncbi:MAG: hypothetical protein HY343_10575 [Lentisphaerae bacterium]|nr:hypothetical protein [Lentisphaerota bacterium]
MKSKVLSGVIALAYLVGAYCGDGGGTAFKVGMFLILPLNEPTGLFAVKREDRRLVFRTSEPQKMACQVRSM